MKREKKGGKRFGRSVGRSLHGIINSLRCEEVGKVGE